MTNNELKILILKNRIGLLKSRAGRENGNIIKKCERKIRNLSQK